MNRNKLSFLALALASTTTFAGTMGTPVPLDKFLILEGGIASTHSFYKNRVVSPESYTAITPLGYAINPSRFYPKDFIGGYAGLSVYVPGWLLNSRYNLFASERKRHYAAGTIIKLAPTKLSLSADKVWGDINAFSYGLGGGAVIEALNKGYARIVISPDNPVSETLQGRSQIKPLVEAFVMYRMTNNFGAKFNVEYQIPVTNSIGRGDVNLNLGINYAFPI